MNAIQKLELLVKKSVNEVADQGEYEFENPEMEKFGRQVTMVLRRIGKEKIESAVESLDSPELVRELSKFLDKRLLLQYADYMISIGSHTAGGNLKAILTGSVKGSR